MDFDQLLNDVLLPILQHLPFKERVRIAQVNRRFKDVSEMAISQTKALSLTAPIFQQAKSKSMSKIIRLSAPNLKEMISEVPHESQVQLRSTILERMDVISNLSLPRLQVFKLDTKNFYKGRMVKLTGLPSLYRLEWKYPRSEVLEAFSGTICEKLEFINLQGFEVSFAASLADYCPNLKHVSLISFLCCGREIESFNTAFAKWPALETLELKPSYEDIGTTLELEKIDSLWKLESLRTLLLHKYCASDQLLGKISVAFPQLERLDITVEYRVTSRGFAVLKNLKHLRHVTLSHWEGDRIAMELINFECLEIVEIITGWLSTVAVSTFVHRCPKLRRLNIRDIQYVNSRKKARSFVRSLYGFVQEVLVINIRYAEVRVWECPGIRSAIARINKTANGRQISIRVGDRKQVVKLGPRINEWDTDPESQRAKEPMKGIGRRLIDSIRDLPRKMSKIFK